MITILFYPEPLKQNPLSRIRRILDGCTDIQYHNNPKEYYDLHIFWSYTKYKITPHKLTLNDPNCINKGCWDISKQKVNDIFNDISINPETHNGCCVKKYEQQARHQFHKLIECPAKKEPGYIYQRYIENKTADGKMFVKHRIYYADGINYIIEQIKPSLFGSDYVENRVVNKEDFFTPEQESDFINKCKLFGFDVGEVEFIPENGVPIIIDVNNVVGGGLVHGLSGTEIHKKIDDTFITFIKNRYEAKKRNEGQE